MLPPVIFLEILIFLIAEMVLHQLLIQKNFFWLNKSKKGVKATTSMIEGIGNSEKNLSKSNLK